jgi:beta-glucosidase
VAEQRQQMPVFPEGFLWGADSSAFQVEGALNEDGRVPSVWDGFGPIENGDTADIATDHYHRYKADVALMREMGLPAYRFSIAWLNRDTAYRFADYAAAVRDRLADRVHDWITINEPAEHTLLGYGIGVHAPGKRLLFDALPVAHHLLLGHGLGVQALRASAGQNIGLANSHGPVWPASDSDQDTFSAMLYDTLMNWLFADPVLLGRYPDDGFAAAMPGPVAEDLEIIATPVDWYGVNYYQPTMIGAPGEDAARSFGGLDIPAELPFGVREIEGCPRTNFGWAVVPDGLHETLTTLRDRYGPAIKPLYITENGCSYGDPVHDTRRIEYLDSHIRAVGRAIADGIDVRAYFAWSFTDNFEWTAGYGQRFGLVHVDYETLQRTPKDSYYWYRDLIRSARSSGQTCS